MATTYWTWTAANANGFVSGKWSTAANWTSGSTHGVPKAGDSVSIGDGDQNPAFTVSASALANIANIAIDNYGALATLKVASVAGFGTAGVLTGDVSLTQDARIEFTTGQITDIASGAVLTLGSATSFLADASSPSSNSALTGLTSIEGQFDLTGSFNGGGASVATAGNLDVAGEADIDFGDYGTSATGTTLIVAKTLTVANNAFLSIGDNYTTAASTVKAASLVNSGQITIGGGALSLLDIASAAGVGKVGVLNGYFNLSGDAMIEFASGEITDIASNGGLELYGASAFVADAGHTSSNSALTGLASIEGSLSLYGGATVTTAAGVKNSGSITIDASTLSIGGVAGLGKTGVLNGSVTVQDSGLLKFASGQITQIAGKGALDIIGASSFVADAASATSNSALQKLASIAALGELELEAGAAVTIGGNLDNAGTIRVDSSETANGSKLVVNGVLTNSGQVEVGPGSYGQASTTNTLQVNGLVNTGSIDLSSYEADSAALLNVKGAAGFGTAGVLHGSVQIGAYSLLEFASGWITDIASNGALILDSASGFLADAGHTSSNSALVWLKSIEGELELSNGAALALNGTLTNSAVYHPVTYSGGLSLSTATLTVKGGFTNSGYATLYNSTLTVDGTLKNTGMSKSANAEVGLIINGVGTVTAAALDNTGSIELTGSAGQALLDIASAAGAGSAGVLSGNIELSGDAMLEFKSGEIASIAADGYLLLDGASAFVADAGSLTSDSALTGLTSVAGTLALGDGAKLTLSHGLTDSGEIDIDAEGAEAGGSSLKIGGWLSNSGVVDIGSYYGGISSAINVTVTHLVNAETSKTKGAIYVYGNSSSGILAKLDVTSGPAGFGTTGVLSGDVVVGYDAVIEFASGEIDKIESGASLDLYTSQAFIADAGSLTSNSALTGLATNAGTLTLEAGAKIATSGALNNTGHIYLDDYSGEGGSQLVVGGVLANSGVLRIGGDSDDSLSAATTITAKGLDDSGAIKLYSIDSADPATLDVTGGVSTISGAISGTGVLELTGGATTIKSGAALSVANWATSGAGTSLIIAANAAYSGHFTLAAGATLTVDAGDTFTLDSSTTIAGAISGEGTLAVGDGATLTPTGAIASSVTLSFFGAGTIDLGKPFAGETSKFGLTDTIDLTALAYKTSFKAVWTAATGGGTLKIEDTAKSNAVVATLKFLGNYANETFEVKKNSATGTTEIGLVAAPKSVLASADILSAGISGLAGSAGGDSEGSLLEPFFDPRDLIGSASYGMDGRAGAGLPTSLEFGHLAAAMAEAAHWGSGAATGGDAIMLAGPHVDAPLALAPDFKLHG